MEQNKPIDNVTTGMAKHWTPPDRIAIKRDSRFEYREVVPEKVKYWESQGFVIDRDAKMVYPEETRMASGTGGFRQMVQMKVLKSVAAERKEYYRKKQEKRMRSSNKGGAAAANASGIRNSGRGVGVVGEHVINHVMTNDQGISRLRREVHTPGEVDPKVAGELSDLSKAQRDEVPLE